MEMLRYDDRSEVTWDAATAPPIGWYRPTTDPQHRKLPRSTSVQPIRQSRLLRLRKSHSACVLRPSRLCPPTSDMALATKAESVKIFEKLKSKPANKVRSPPTNGFPSADGTRSASTAAPKTQHGRRCRSASTCASTAPPSTAISVSTSRSCAPQTSIVSMPLTIQRPV
jgi:hypothetical protein